MNTQHTAGITRTIIGSTQRLFRSSRTPSLLATHHIDARTMRDIGITQFGVN